MAITSSGLYFLTLEKQLADTISLNWESETNRIMLTNDTETPAFDTDNFRDDVTEVTGTNWATPGVALTGTEITVAAGILTFDATDVSVASTTLAAVMASVLHAARGGASSADELFMLHDFVTQVDTSAGTFGIQWNASGLVTADLVP